MAISTKTVYATSIAASAMLLCAAPALAADPYLGLEYGRSLGLPGADIRDIATSLVRSILGLLGLVLVAQIMWGGFLMMTHGGNEDRMAKAKGTLKDAVIGIVLIMSASSLVQFVVDAVLNATGGYV